MLDTDTKRRIDTARDILVAGGGFAWQLLIIVVHAPLLSLIICAEFIK